MSNQQRVEKEKNQKLKKTVGALNQESSQKKQFDDQNKLLQKREKDVAEKEKSLQQREKDVAEQDKRLQQREKELDDRNSKLQEINCQQEERQLELERGLPALRDKMFAEREQQLQDWKQELLTKEQELKTKSEELQLEQEKVDADFVEERANLQQELQKKRLEAQDKLYKEIEQQREELYKENEQRREELFKNLDNELRQRREDLEEKEKQYNENKTQLERDWEEVRLNRLDINAREEGIDQKIEERIKSRLDEFEQNERIFKNNEQRLLALIKSQNSLHSLYEELEKALGDRSPEEVLLDLTLKTEELNRLREELLQPSKELEEYYDNHRAEITRLKEENKNLQSEKCDLQKALDTQEQLEYDRARWETKCNNLEVRYDAVVADNNKLKEDLKRLRAAYNDPESVEQRIKNIKRPYFENFIPRRQETNINELKWLETIRSKIEDYGLQFSHRILCAFHTALKISEWSPLTVLAGVSGTGKSELPKLYSRFGGINFINVPVQPNWDSQESMLGYFNSISNSYEAQPMLNFLVQSREGLVIGSDNPEDNYNGLDDTVSLVLLDEMNLAHVELYFAEFLSKLEQRRAATTSELPHIDINLGSDMAPYQLSLGRNLLFAGTMNQDETTKSLSDKVIDRGTSIYFPRPDSLHRREKLKSLPEQADLIKLKTWWQWINKESNLSDDIIKPYKKLIEDINKCLGADGKALGHRVWQSIEYYMVNHPLVKGLDAQKNPNEYKEALKFAFEDQLVQKVMPKLRGIETRGYAKEHCLDPIRELLAKEKLDILEDFDKAMRISHGQFSWASADYLNNEQSNKRFQELFNLASQESQANTETP